MRLDVLTPVGPGHEQHMARCAESVRRAVALSPGPFSEVRHLWQDDRSGLLGRSEARNALLRRSDAEWVFVLDCDDLMAPEALTLWREGLDVIWGEQWFMGEAWVAARNQNDLDDLRFADVVILGPWGTVCTGHYIRGSVARSTPWLGYLDNGEDFEHHMTLMSRYRWAKVAGPLALIQEGGSATGPRRATTNWSHACRRVLDFWTCRGRFAISDAWRQRQHYWVGHSGLLEGGTPDPDMWVSQAQHMRSVAPPSREHVSVRR